MGAFNFRETDPEQAFAIITQCRDAARRLNETWLELFFDAWRLGTLTGDLEDFARALPLAMELVVRFNGPDGQGHCNRVGVLTNVLCTYTNIDPFGYREELERGFSHLDGLITVDPETERFVLYHRWADYLADAERLEEAGDVAYRTLALADRSRNAVTQSWHGAWALYRLCRVCDALQGVEELVASATRMMELSKKGPHLRRTQADASFWLAVSQLLLGKKPEASRFFHAGMRLLKGLESCETICAEPVARYHELAGDWKAAVSVRDRELAAATKKGMLHRGCKIHLERCRLLNQGGEITAADLSEARLLAAQLRHPEWFLERLARIAPSGPPEGGG